MQIDDATEYYVRESSPDDSKLLDEIGAEIGVIAETATIVENAPTTDVGPVGDFFVSFFSNLFGGSSK